MSANLATFLTSDNLLACLSLFIIAGVLLRIGPNILWHELRQVIWPNNSISDPKNPFSLPRAYQSFRRYPTLAKSEINRMHASYSTLSRAHKRIGYSLGYTKKLDKLHDVTDRNAKITRDIYELAKREFRLDESLLMDSNLFAASPDLGRVREALKHFVRDWSEEGAAERENIFAPILNVLREVGEAERGDQKVLVPGCGLGRLAWEISQLGFDTTANELSFFMTLAFRFLLAPSTTSYSGQHTIYPFSHWFSHQRKNTSLFRGVKLPDVVPRLSPNFRLEECNFLTLKPPAVSDSIPPDSFWLKDGQVGGYDYIVTLFFIDTSLNVIETIEHIYRLLRPGGTWINLGPLLWTGGAQAKVELSLEEVLQLVKELGFTIEGEEDGNENPTRRRRTVPCEYTGDSSSMMRWIYQAEFWVARKSKS